MNPRLLALVTRPDDVTACWTWNGFRDRDGYGRIRSEGAMRGAHRIFYELMVGPIGDGLTIDHLCRNRACVNPAHLEPVTALENTRRATDARTHCRNGHIYSDENARVRPTGGRSCRMCDRARAQEYRARLACREVVDA